MQHLARWGRCASVVPVQRVSGAGIRSISACAIRWRNPCLGISVRVRCNSFHTMQVGDEAHFRLTEIRAVHVLVYHTGRTGTVLQEMPIAVLVQHCSHR